MTIEITWNCLSEKFQKELIALGLGPENTNWDVFPMAIVEIEDEVMNE